MEASTTIAVPVATRPPEISGPERGFRLSSLIAAAILAGFYLATSVYIASHRLYWFDELFIVRIAQLPSVAAMWQALAHASDTMPPGYHLLMRMVGRTFGYSEIVMRLPSALAMVAGLLLAFDCARRLTDGLYGLIAFALLTCSLLPYYGYEARPYAIYFLLSALAFWLWICTEPDNKWFAFLFGAVLCLAVTMHYYAALCVVPYVLWELVDWKSGKHPSLKLIAGLIGVGFAGGVLAPLAMAFSRQFSRDFWAHPSFFKLRTGFFELFPNALFLLALGISWIVLCQSRSRTTVVQPRRPAESLGWLFFCIPLVGFLLAELRTNAFLMRYFIGVLPGVAVAFSCLLWRHFKNLRHISAGVLALLVAWGTISQWMAVRHPERIDPFGQQTATRQYLQLEDSVLSNGKQFILFDNPMLHMEAKYYSQHPNECILLLREDAAEEIPTMRVQVNLSHYSPLRFWKLDDLRRHAGETALIDPAPETLQALRQAGLQVSVRYSKPLEVVYLQ
ncbi:MAG: glycosyltransferase family 39 protein [Candidatus Korobacteraceae bacterium]